MPVPSKMADLFTLPASNSPSGSDAIGNSLDDYLRATQAILRSTNALSSATLASASTTDLGSSDAEAVTVTGTTGITSFGTTPAGIVREVTFTGSLTITNSAAIALSGGTNYTTSANDVLRFRSLGSGNWKQIGSNPLGFVPVNKAGDTGVGSLSLTGNLSATGTITSGGVFATSGTSVVVGTNAAGTVFLRPNGSGSATGQTTIANDGHVSMAGIADVAQPLTTMQTASGNPGFAINATSNAFSSCYMQFNRIGFFYCYFGVDQNNNLAVGGGSFGATSYRVVHEGLASPTLSGTVTATNFVATSDRRKKKGVKKAKPRDLSALSKGWASWTMKGDGSPGIGLIAQDVQKVAPEHVHKGKDGFLGIDKAGIALEHVLALSERLERLEKAIGRL